ncbi:MAG: DUF2007 domain-containing protein [Clostridia bacterium]|nr:DUF2007 domain-containing protein [Clostridia bacterium]
MKIKRNDSFMIECSNCKASYEVEERCPKCGFKEGLSLAGAELDWTLLTTVANDIEFGMVAGLLEMANIPVIREVKGVDAYLQVILGVPLAGISVLVPRGKYEEALELLNSSADEDVPEEEVKE